LANVTLSQTTDTIRGDVVHIRSSRASRTAAMIEAQIAIIEAKRS
jgi:lipopolysaccharide export system protein LptA